MHVFYLLGVFVILIEGKYEPLPKSGAALAAVKRILEPKFSLKGPFTEADNRNWELVGDASVEAEGNKPQFVRLTPPRPKKAGTLFSKYVNNMMTDWEINVEVDVHGAHQAGEGIGLWYVNKLLLGPVYGMSDHWQGLGILLDTFNDDGKGYTNHISAVYNDGSVSFNHADDGQAQAFATCGVMARNLKDTFYMRMIYLNKKMTVDYASSRGPDGIPEFRKCMEFENIELGMDSLFGVTASTKALLEDSADYHDVIRIETYNLSPSQTADAAERRRVDFERDAEARHKKHQLSNPEFMHVVSTSLRQILGNLAGMDSNMLSIEGMVEHNDRYNENMLPQRLKFIGDDDGFQNDQIVATVRAILDTQKQLARDISHPNPGGSGEEAMLIAAAQTRLTQEMARVKTNLMALAGPTGTADTSTLRREGEEFIAKLSQATERFGSYLSNFDSGLREAQSGLDSVGAGTPGKGLVLLLLTVDVLFGVLLYQMLRSGGIGGIDSRYKDL